MDKFYSVSGKQKAPLKRKFRLLYESTRRINMNPFYFIKEELSAAWKEVNRPLFPESSENESHTELFNYYHSLKGKTIDSCNGESLFPIIIDRPHSINKDHVQIARALRQKLSEASSLADIEARNWKLA
jgi:hypothetical protein